MTVPRARGSGSPHPPAVRLNDIDSDGHSVPITSATAVVPSLPRSCADRLRQAPLMEEVTYRRGRESRHPGSVFPLSRHGPAGSSTMKETQIVQSCTTSHGFLRPDSTPRMSAEAAYRRTELSHLGRQPR